MGKQLGVLHGLHSRDQGVDALLVCPTVAVRTKHRVIRRHIAVFFFGEFVELKRVFVVCLRLQFQESLGGVFNERFASLDAVV
jgi:hypothetical protein